MRELLIIRIEDLFEGGRNSDVLRQVYFIEIHSRNYTYGQLLENVDYLSDYQLAEYFQWVVRACFTQR